jgi:uncharacterized membrane protein
MLISLVVAIIVQKMHREGIKEQLGISFKLNRWFVIAWILLPLIAGITINALFAFGEDVEWRGFMHRECGDMGF